MSKKDRNKKQKKSLNHSHSLRPDCSCGYSCGMLNRFAVKMFGG